MPGRDLLPGRLVHIQLGLLAPRHARLAVQGAAQPALGIAPAGDLQLRALSAQVFQRPLVTAQGRRQDATKTVALVLQCRLGGPVARLAFAAPGITVVEHVEGRRDVQAGDPVAARLIRAAAPFEVAAQADARLQ
ncbi:hypothetical protein D9M71_178330 [compost metagenome]